MCVCVSNACDSGEKFRESLAIKPQFHEALHDWALAFLDRATAKEGPESDALFALSYEKFEQALAINRVRAPSVNIQFCDSSLSCCLLCRMMTLCSITGRWRSQRRRT